ncbi:Adenylate-forming Reductase [Pleurotus pulmonarius]
MIALPPTDGSLLLSQTIGFHLEHNPIFPMYMFAEEGSENVTTITFLEFARACHRVAHHVRPVGSTQRPGQVVAIIASCDTIVYQALVVGCLKAGLVPFPISPRNSPLAVIQLLKTVDCHRILCTNASLKGLFSGIRAEIDRDNGSFPVNTEEIPSLSEVYPCLGRESASDPFSPYPEHPTTASLSSVALYLHSSGSTGFPKVIPLTQAAILQWAALPSVADVKNSPHRFGSMALPSFHTLGIYLQILSPIFAGVTAGVYPPTMSSATATPIMPTPDNILDHARRTRCDVIVALPTLLQIWSHSPATLEYLKSLYLIVWSGGSPPKKVGDALVAAGVACRSLYGSTEFGAPLRWLYRDNLDDWEYMQFPQSDHFRWIPQGAGRYELHILSSEIGHINVPNLPDNGYATSDLFEKHPTKDGLWRLVARVDDVIVHATGEKTVPTPMETIIGSHPAIQGVVVFGERQVQPGVLIELRDSARYPKSDEELELLRNFLWQTIEEANSAAPAFSRIYKDMMLFVSPDRPLPRAGKGTVMRKAAITLYADDIQKLYDIIDAGVSSSTVKDPEDWSPEGLRAWLSTQALDLMPNKTFSIGGDLFEEGFDSLSATLLRHRIAAALRSNPKTPQQSLDVSQTLVYDHPSIGKLADTLSSLASEPATSIEDRASRIEAMIELNISKLEPIKPPSDDVSGGATVLLTGSTGGLGSQLLCALLKNDNVQRVFTFNRTGSTPASARQRASFQDKGLDVTLLASHKLVSYEGDLPRRYFGLEEDTYNNLRDSVTIIIHNGWRLDFNLTLPSFEPLVTGTRNLVNMARTGPRASTIRFLFTSSISSVQSWQGDGLVPEDIIPDASVAVGAGYGESKYVVERILAASGIQACSLRIGQICGGEPNGAWSFTDWVPILVKSSIALKALPDTQGIVSWIQMDCVAQVALDIAFSQRSKLPAVVNIVHPRPVAWTTLFTAIQQALKANTRGRVTLPLIPFKEWHELLQAQALDADEKTILQIPAIKLLDFFRHIANAPEDAKGLRESGGLPALSVQQALDLSPSLRGAQDVAAVSALKWLGYWINGGLFT